MVSVDATNASVTDLGNGEWEISPAENFFGTIDLSYQVSDGTVSCTRAIGTGGLSPRKRRATTSAEPSKSSRAAQLTLAWCSF